MNLQNLANPYRNLLCFIFKRNYLSPNNSFAVLVVPFVLRADLDFLPIDLSRRLRLNSVALVFDAIWSSKFCRSKWCYQTGIAKSTECRFNCSLSAEL